MKAVRFLLIVVLACFLLSGCGGQEAETAGGDHILATTYPMYYLTQRLTEGMENVTVELMVSEPVSCLHNYTLTTGQMKKLQRADLIVMNGGGLEGFMASALEGVPEERIVTAGGDGDPHYWLSPMDFQAASLPVADALRLRYPDRIQTIEEHLDRLTQELTDLQGELEGELQGLSCRKMITFHDGFSWFASAFGLKIAAAVEEEEGAEASAGEIKEICDLIGEHHIPAIFVEKNGSTNAAQIIARETGAKIYTLTTMMDGQTDYFTAMRENIAAVKEALS